MTKAERVCELIQRTHGAELESMNIVDIDRIHRAAMENVTDADNDVAAANKISKHVADVKKAPTRRDQ